MFFFKIIIFVKDNTETKRMCLQVWSWEGLHHICQSSGLQLCPNAFYTPVKRLLLWLITWCDPVIYKLLTLFCALYIGSYLDWWLSRLNHTIISSTQMFFFSDFFLNYLWYWPHDSIVASFLFPVLSLTPSSHYALLCFPTSIVTTGSGLLIFRLIWLNGNQQLLPTLFFQEG